MIEDRPGRETVVRIPHRAIRDKRGRISRFATDDNRASVEVWDDSCPLPIRLYFAHAGIGHDAPLVGFEVGSEVHSGPPLEPATLARVVGNLPLYVQYARAIAKLDRAEVAEALEIFTAIGTTRRGLPGRFYRVIANDYAARVQAGDSAPITSIAEAHDVVKSTASRWIKEARRRGYIEGGNRG